MIIEVADVMVVKAERTKESLPAVRPVLRSKDAAGRDSFVPLRIVDRWFVLMRP